MARSTIDWVVPTVITLSVEIGLAVGLTRTGLSFWGSVGVLVALDTAIIVRQAIVGSLIFRLWARKRMTEAVRRALRDEDFPTAEPGEDAHGFLLRISSDETELWKTRMIAVATLARLEEIEAVGFLTALRAHNVFNAAIHKR